MLSDRLAYADQLSPLGPKVVLSVPSAPPPPKPPKQTPAAWPSGAPPST